MLVKKIVRELKMMLLIKLINLVAFYKNKKKEKLIVPENLMICLHKLTRN